MQPTFIIAGRLAREFLLPPAGPPLLDVAGGSLLYAAGGLTVWEKEIGLLGRVGEDYPRAWLKVLEGRGLDLRGIRILPQGIDLRSFIAYNEKFEVSRGAPVSQFVRRGLPFPKSLLGYQRPPEVQKDAKKPDPLAPLPVEIPRDYLEARAVHLCPLDFMSHNQLAHIFKTASVGTITLDPSPGYMSPSFYKELRSILSGLTAFLPSEEELRALFWGETHDLWEMASALGSYGCEIIVVKRGARGQMVYDVGGKHKWEVPAFSSRLADPTGAGDAFCGGFLAGYKKTYDPVQAALYGNISASLKVEGSGAFYPLETLTGLAEARLHALKGWVRAA
ncbi:MAG TPA: carbohydrate kinase family protein [Anaerolineales bacterium]|nr:carbohydrate kinase family protein [Anaerolineales bacterium]